MNEKGQDRKRKKFIDVTLHPIQYIFVFQECGDLGCDWGNLCILFVEPFSTSSAYHFLPLFNVFSSLIANTFNPCHISSIFRYFGTLLTLFRVNNQFDFLFFLSSFDLFFFSLVGNNVFFCH